MDARPKTRQVDRERKTSSTQVPRGAKQIVIPMTQQQYDDIWHDADRVRSFIEQCARSAPELFPAGCDQGYCLHGFGRESLKLSGLKLRKSRCRARCLTDLIPSLGVDSGETVQVRQVRRRDGDGIPRLAGERRLSGKDGIGVEGIGRCRRDARLSEEGPELRSLDDRVGGQGQVSQAATGIEIVLEASQATDGADSEEFATEFVMGDFGDNDGRAGCRDGFEPGKTTHDLRLAGSTDDQAERSTVQQDQPRHD